MDQALSKVESDRKLIHEARERGTGATIGVYAKLSGPGWLQGAITLGGGSLAGSLYLGVIGGYQLLWLQPLMMILGIVMLGAISYVTLSTGERPFDSINRHINPVLGWGWVIATLMANLVWAMPQFSLGSAALQQNLLPGLLAGATGKYVAVAFLFVAAAVVVWFYDSGGWGFHLFEVLLKIMVGVIVVSFFGVVLAMTLSEQGLAWGSIMAGFVPNLRLLFEPADRFTEIVAQTSAPDYWREEILFTQRDRMVAAAATAVGINMTFLLPYSMLKRGWDRDFRGLAVFDLSTGLFVPFVLVTSCVVIASATQFHSKYDAGLVGEAARTITTQQLEGDYKNNLDKRLKQDKQIDFAHLATDQKIHDEKIQARREELLKSKNEQDVAAAVLEDPNLQLGYGPLDQARNNLPLADRKVAAMLVRRDAFLLANSLEDLTGETIAQKVFGIGVLGMAISSWIRMQPCRRLN